jgi:hypothetical protein
VYWIGTLGRQLLNRPKLTTSCTFNNDDDDDDDDDEEEEELFTGARKNKTTINTSVS